MLLRLDEGRRHHSTCILNDKVYLIGGYGKHRIALDTMTSIDLKTGSQKNLSVLPNAVYSPAVCAFQQSRIFVIKSVITSYNVDLDFWSVHNEVELPKCMEFNNAMASGDTLYLTAVHSYELYSFKPDQLRSERKSKIQLKKVGKFANEAQNTCLLNDVIYSFSTDQFDRKSYIETYDIKTDKFELVWEKETDDFDFSPYSSIGCFPLLQYTS